MSDWLEWRRGGIGGSDVAGIVGVSPWASPWSVWARKVGVTSEQADSPAMEFGRRAEDMLADWLADKTGVEIVGQQRQCTHPVQPWMRCTVDGFTAEVPATVVEFKTTSEEAWESVPVHYQCQAQWNMAVTGSDRCIFGVLHIAHGRPDFHVYEVAADPDEQTFLIDRCSAFWHDHVLTGEPPPTDGHDATTTALNDAWPDTQEGVLDADDEIRRLVTERHQATAEAARWTDIAQAKENALRALMGDKDTIRDGKRNLVTWRWQDRRNVDLNGLRAAVPELVKANTTTTSTRVLRINKAAAA